MQLIQILLPLTDNAGRRQPSSSFAATRESLVDKFGGVTMYQRAPARGVWQDKGSKTFDDVLIFEVVADNLERPWWRSFRKELERRFKQKEILIRAMDFPRCRLQSAASK